MIFQQSPKVRDLSAKLTAFLNESIYPAEKTYGEQLAAGGRWQIPPMMEELKSKARAAGLWNLFLPESEFGAGLTNLEYAPLCEIMGRSFIAPEVFNCSAPDTGNMEVLVRYGTPEQKEALVESTAGGRNPFLFRHDRTGCRLVRRDQHPSDHCSPRRSLCPQRQKMVDLRRGRSALQDLVFSWARPIPPHRRINSSR